MWRSCCLHLNPKPYPNPLMKFHWDHGYVGSDQQTSLDLSWKWVFKRSQGTSLLLILRCHYVIWITWRDRSLQFTQEILKRSSNTSSYLHPNNKRTTRYPGLMRKLQDLPCTWNLPWYSPSHPQRPLWLVVSPGMVAYLPLPRGPDLGSRVFVAHYGAQSTRLQHPIPGAWNLWCFRKKEKHDSEMMMSHSRRVVSFCYLS